MSFSDRGFTLSLALISLVLTIVLFFPVLYLIFSTSVGEYLYAIGDREVLLSIYLSILTASIATVISAIFGIPLAYILARKEFPFKDFIDSLLDLPILIPHTVAGIALLTVFGPRALIGSALKDFGIVFTNTIYGIVLAQVFVSSPLLVKTVKEVIAKIDESYVKSARTLGASALRAFFDIELPLAKRGIVTGAILCWARAVSEFGAIIILAYYPTTAPVLIFIRFETVGFSAAKAISALLLVVTLAIFIVLKLVQRWSEGAHFRG